MHNNKKTEVVSKLNDIDIQILSLIEKRISILEDENVHNGAYIQNFIQSTRSNINEKDIQSILNQLNKLNIKEKTPYLYSREYKVEDTLVTVGPTTIGGAQPTHIFGPCSAESEEQLDAVAQSLKDKGLFIMRAGAYKPRTSPYDFQGYGEAALRMLSDINKKYQLAVVSEIVDASQIQYAEEHLDMIQIGARNMHNFELLKAVGKSRLPVILKRGLSATISEWLMAAEYILKEGNTNVVLCERGIRTYENATRNTLDLSAVPIIKRESHLPIIVDVTHSTGRKDIMADCAKAALAVGAHGIMAEVHPSPITALSDNQQQVDLAEFDTFFKQFNE